MAYFKEFTVKKLQEYLKERGVSSSGFRKSSGSKYKIKSLSFMDNFIIQYG
jgi:hypothetical protein